LRFVDDLEAAQRHLLAGVKRDARLIGGEQIMTCKRAQELHRRQVLPMKLATEGERILDELARLAILEERPLVALDDEPGGRVEAEQQFIAAWLLHQDERIAASIGRNVAILRPGAALADEEILAVGYAQHRYRGARLAGGEDDGVATHREGELDRVHHKRIGVAGEGEALLCLERMLGV